MVQSIEKAPLVNLDGLIYQRYEEFFGKDYKLTIPEHIDFETLESQENLNRVVVKKKSKFGRQLAIFFMQTKITDALSRQFSVPLRFSSVDLWTDDIGFALEPHVDDESIKLHLQIYLSDNSVGTSLYNQGKHRIHTFDFKQNTGYALLNNEHSFHGVEKVTQSGRTSIYARYK